MFKKVAEAANFWPGEKATFLVGNKRLLLIHHGGEIVAYEDRCPHLGAKLSEGCIQGETLTCPAHAWEYDVATGQGINPKEAKLHRYPVRMMAGEIWVDVDA
jgi:toluene monooxygenase system ferredoxin subunit